MFATASKLALYTIIALATTNMALAGTHSQAYSVELNKTELVRLNGSASAVVVGNPQIADVSVHSDRTLFVVGRSFGETNIIVMDGAGDVIMNANVQVTSSLPVNGVRVYNGTHANRSTFNCSPYCLPAPVLGDNPEFIITNQNDVPAINNQIAGQTSTGTAGIAAGSTSGPANIFDDDPIDF